jgi:hypothetical protein
VADTAFAVEYLVLERSWHVDAVIVFERVAASDEGGDRLARRYGFVAGGGDPWYSRTLNALKEGHRVFVHIPGEGYVGIGEVTGTTRPVREFKVTENGREVPLLEAGLAAPNMDHDLDDADKCEYVVPVNWVKTVPRESSFWEPNLFANQNTAARLRDTDTIARLEQHFGLTGDEGESTS